MSCSSRSHSGELSRRRFLESSCALLGVALVGTAIGGCSNEPDGPPRAVAQNDGFVVENLTLPAPGQAISFVFPDEKPGLLFTTNSGVSGAVSAVCTHLGCIVEWTGNDKAAFNCPCHASQFGPTGQTLGGPAQQPLPFFEATPSDRGVRLTKI